MNLKRLWVGLLCVGFTLSLVGELSAQEQEQKQRREGGRRWRWKGPDIGTEIKDFNRYLR